MKKINKLYICPVHFIVKKNVMCGQVRTTVAESLTEAKSKFMDYITTGYKSQYITYDSKGNPVIDKDEETLGGCQIYKFDDIQDSCPEAFMEEEFKRVLIDNTYNKYDVECETIDGWSIYDIIERAEYLDNKVSKKPITKRQAGIILRDMMNNADANVGVNWDTIDYYTEKFFNENFQTSKK
jgi:hypothetical protein